MSTLITTTVIATALVIVCAIFLGIGKLITGKSMFSCKRCGKPEDKSKCSLCKKNKKKPPRN